MDKIFDDKKKKNFLETAIDRKGKIAMRWDRPAQAPEAPAEGDQWNQNQQAAKGYEMKDKKQIVDIAGRLGKIAERISTLK